MVEFKRAWYFKKEELGISKKKELGISLDVGQEEDKVLVQKKMSKFWPKELWCASPQEKQAFTPSPISDLQ